MFMSIYGLSVFLETPKRLRHGRTRYIVLSFILTGLMGLTASLDAAWIFHRIFGATSGLGFSRNFAQNVRVWERYLSMGSVTAVILIGDALLVCCYPLVQNSYLISLILDLPMLRYLDPPLVGYHLARAHSPCIHRYATLNFISRPGC
jgi:hypothetical protein